MKSFDEVFEDKTRYGFKIKTNNYKDHGKHIIIDQGQEQIAGYTDLEEGLFCDIPAIIFGDHTRVLKYIDKPFFLGADGTKILKSKMPNANHKYLFYALKSAKIPNTGYNRHFKLLKEVKIAYPSSEQQNNIVKTLDELTSIIEKRKAELQTLDDLIKARFVEMFGDANVASDTVRLADVSVSITDGSHNPPKGINHSDNYMISSQNIQSGTISYDDVRYLSDEDFAKEDKRTQIRKNDVLLTIVGAVGRSAVVSEDKRLTAQRSVCVIHPNFEVINSVFLKHLLDNISSKIENEAHGIAQKGVYLKQVKEIRIICPEKDKQELFSDFVKEVDKSKVVVQKSLDEAQTLFDSLMQKYFG